jgi:hypothetical protein
MVGVQSVVEGVVETFGPFLIPVTVFAIGIVGYTVLYLMSRQFRRESEEGVVNLSAGTPERSATDNDYGASTRGVRPYDDDEEGATTDGTEADGTGRSGGGSSAGTGPEHEGDDGRTSDAPRHND